ncbi:MAG: hypothetical protein ACKO6N_10195 [Myxococcota bacterium]
MKLTPELLRIPLLSELEALGGEDQPHFVLERLARHFPLLEPDEAPIEGLTRKLAAQLEREGLLIRARARWRLTPRGREVAHMEGLAQTQLLQDSRAEKPSAQGTLHRRLQETIQSVGEWLGFAAMLEVEHYDVVWKEHPESERFSHVFEVQVAGSVDSALTRLQQAWKRQRSLPVLVIADLHAETVAEARLKAAFLELKDALQVVTAAEVLGLAQALEPQVGMLVRLGRCRMEGGRR